MTCYGAVQVNKHNLFYFVVKNSAVIKINKNKFHSILQIHYSGLYSPKCWRLNVHFEVFTVMLTGLVMFYFRCRKDVAILQLNQMTSSFKEQFDTKT